MAVTVNDTINTQLEQVRTTLEPIFSQGAEIASKVKKSTKAQEISRYLYRMPFKRYNGGNFTKVNANGGSLGRGTSQKFGNLTGGYFRTVLAFQLTSEQVDTSANSQQAIVNTLSDLLANVMKEAQVLDDITFHQNGTGILTNSSSAIAAGANATMTFAASTDLLGVNRLREGMTVSVWDSTGATERAAATAAPIIIINVDYDSRTVTFDQDVTSLTLGDIIAFRGMAAYGPSTLTSFSASYPGTPPVTGNGIGGDSFRHGFPYMTDPTASNYFYGVQKSSVSQLLPVRVNASNTALEWEHIFRLIAKVQQKRDNDPWKNLIGIANMAQRTALMQLGMNITTNMQQSGDFGRSLDEIPSNVGYSDVFNMGGIPCYTSRRQDRGRIDFIDLNKIERAQLFDTRFVEFKGRSGYVFEGRNSSGEVTYSFDMFIEQAYDFVCVDDGVFALIDNLALPSAAYDA